MCAPNPRAAKDVVAKSSSFSNESVCLTTNLGRNRITRRSLLAPALLAAVAVAGCGGSKELSRTELIAKSNVICKHGNAALKTSKISPANLATVAPQVAAVDQKVSSELAELKPPPAMTADWGAIVDSWKRAGEGLTKIGQAARAKQKTQEMIGEGIFTKAQTERATTARRNGLTACSESRRDDLR